MAQLGCPIPEVARRAGHGSDVLLKIYAGCIDSGSAAANARIDDALGDQVDEDDQGDAVGA